MIVMHTCDMPACVNPAHLRVGTQLNNVRDSIAKGRWYTDKRIAGYQSEAKHKRSEIGIPEPGDGYDMGVFVILEKPENA